MHLTALQMSVISKNALFSGDFCWDKFPGVYAKAINLSRKVSFISILVTLLFTPKLLACPELLANFSAKLIL